MPDALSSSIPTLDADAREHFPRSAQAALLLLNTVPLVHIVACLLVLLYGFEDVSSRLGSFLGMLLLVPPIAARIILKLRPLPEGRVRMDTSSFFVWWLVFQLQVVFCRLPFIEEMMRLVPGLYSAWLRLWGSKIGRCVYWGAETRVLERSMLRIGSSVVFGAGVRLNGHVLEQRSPKELRQRGERLELVLGTINIGDRALIGGYSLITAGSTIPALSITPPCALFAPFSSFEKSKRRGQMILPLHEAAL